MLLQRKKSDEYRNQINVQQIRMENHRKLGEALWIILRKLFSWILTPLYLLRPCLTLHIRSVWWGRVIASRKNPVRISLQWRDKCTPALWPLSEASRCAKTPPSAITQRTAPQPQVKTEKEKLILDLRRLARLWKRLRHCGLASL